MNESRRKVLKWTPPLVTAVILPAHAQTSMCISQLIMIAPVPSKCSGTPPVGNAILSINSDGADALNPDLEIVAINVIGAAATDTINLPTLPAIASTSSSVDLEWTGSASDALTCLPLSTISFEVTYQCTGVVTQSMQSFSLTTVLADAIP